MSWLSRWRARRRAILAARRCLSEDATLRTLPGDRQRELLTLRKVFAHEKMGQWTERASLYVLASRLPANACIVEVGSWVGVGTCYLAAGLRAGGGGRVYAVDTFKGTTIDPTSQSAWAASVAKMGGSTLPLLRTHMRRFGLEGLVTPIELPSVAAAASYDGPPVDLLYIDGDHVYEAVRADFEAWFPRVRPNAFVVFHDYDERHRGVRKFVDEALMGPLRGYETDRVGALLSVHVTPAARTLA